MIGWFAMNAPSGLGLYWVFNNVLTTVSTVTVKKLVEQASPVTCNLQPCVMEAATLRDGGCNPTGPRLQPYVAEAATLRGRGCNPTWPRL